MARRYEIPHPFRYHCPQLGWSLILFFILVIGGCMHHKEHHGEARDQPGYAHGKAMSPHEEFGSSRTGFQGEPHHGFSRTMEKELMLTTQQKEAFDRLETNYEKMVIRKTADIRAAEVDLAAILSKEDYDRQAIQEQVGNIAGLKEEMMMARIDSLLKLKALLTEGQYDQFQEILKQRMSQMTGHSPHGSF